ncbi:uncharacterized protein [Amphiura filiformis]|uniref:uncharacterized protein n=1 Tax=Amphiura filiformis TaxID=82378 RepID=UPI003B20C92F
MREALDGFTGGVKFGGSSVTNLRYADDTTLICSSRGDLLAILKCIKEASEEKGLLLNAKKTKVMVIDRNGTGEDFLIDGQKIEEVKQFEYLGSMIDNKARLEIALPGGGMLRLSSSSGPTMADDDDDDDEEDHK